MGQLPDNFFRNRLSHPQDQRRLPRSSPAAVLDVGHSALDATAPQCSDMHPSSHENESTAHILATSAPGAAVKNGQPGPNTVASSCSSPRRSAAEIACSTVSKPAAKPSTTMGSAESVVLGSSTASTSLT